MKYTTSFVDENTLKFTFTVPALEYSKAIHTYVDKHNNEYNLPGVRKGRVTAKMIETLRGRDVLVAPVINELMSDAYSKAANEYPEMIYYSPIMRIEQEGSNKDLICSATVQINPVIELCDYKSLRLSEEDIAAAEEDAAKVPEEDRASTRRYLLQSKMVSLISENSTGEIPDTMATERAEQILAAFDQQLGNNGLEIEKYYEETGTTEEELFADFTEQAKLQLHSRLSLLELAKAEGLLATEEEYEAELVRMSDMYLMGVDRLREIFAKREGAKVKKDISIAKAADFVGEMIDRLYPAE